MLSKRFSRTRGAEVTVEIALSLGLSLVVLFLVLALFSDNLQSMAVNGGINNLFNRKNEIAKTQNDSWGIDPTKTQIAVQTIGDQGLNDYVNRAKDKCKTYYTANPTTQAQIEDLAKALTILSVNVNSTSLNSKYKTSDYNVDLDSLKKSYVNIVPDNGKLLNHIIQGSTTLKNDLTKIITYQSPDNESIDILTIVKEITRKSF